MKIFRYNYIVLFILGAVFAAPGIAAYLFYLHPQWLSSTTTNKGVFLDPPVLLAHRDERDGALHPKALDFDAHNTGKHAVTAKVLDVSAGPKWRLVLWSPTACEQRCLDQLDKLARIRLALGRHLYEVEPQLLIADNAEPLSPGLVSALQEQDIHVLRFPIEAQKRVPVLKSRLEIFIANPDNYLVLAYLPTVKPGDIFHDIKQLLNTTDKMRK